MASGVDPSKVETDELLNDFLSSYSSDLMGLSFGLSLLNHLVGLSLLLDIVLDEVLFRIFLQSQSWLQDLIYLFPDLSQLGLHVPVLLTEVHVLDLFSEEEREQDVWSRSRPVEDIDSELSQSD